MATSIIGHTFDSLDRQGPLLNPSLMRVNHPGEAGHSAWGDRVPHITTLRQQERMTDNGTAYGREPIVSSRDERFLDSNDVRDLSFRLRIDPLRDLTRDRDGDGFDADTIVLEFADLADVDRSGVEIYVNGVHVHVPHQGNGETDVFSIRTDDNVLDVRVVSGEPGRPDGWTMSLDCFKQVPVDDFVF